MSRADRYPRFSPQFPQDDDTGLVADDRFVEPPAELQDARAARKQLAQTAAHLKGVVEALSDACGHLAALPALPELSEVETSKLREELNEWIARFEKAEGGR